MIEIEYSDKHTSLCECCGGRTTVLTRFVHDDGATKAAYYVRFSDNHPEEHASAVISIGPWGEGVLPSERLAFPMVFFLKEGRFTVMLTDAEVSPWKEVDILGRMLDREEALTHELKDEVFHITDHISWEDEDVQAFFRGISAASP